MESGKRRPRPAMVVAVIALIVALSGTAFAALGKNSVGSRQLKKGAVTKSKLATGAVTSAKVANGSLTGKDVDLNALGTVPSATNVSHAGNADAVGGHSASCPAGTILIRGVCFDSSPSGPVLGVQAAADACAQKGGYLPTTEALVSARGILNLGDGNGSNSQFTDSYAYNTSGAEPTTVVVNSTSEKRVYNEEKNGEEELEPVAVYQYTCAYPLVR